MTNERKINELSKLNKAQRATMRNMWGQPIDVIYVEDMLVGYRQVKVRNEKMQWLCVELGPRGAVHSKAYHQF